MRLIIRRIKRNLIDSIKSFRLYKFYSIYNPSLKRNDNSLIIVMFDGKIKHGGLSDRLWGILSIYKYCKEQRKIFKLHFIKPFALINFLVPNKIDWSIRPEEIIYDLHISKPKYISMVSHDWNIMFEILKRKLKSNKPQQHIYTNTRVIGKKEFGNLFHELFKMSPLLEVAFKAEQKKIPTNYISCTFRFQQLLGDFKEGNFKTLDNYHERELLMDKCKETLIQLNRLKGNPILVTSDSHTFLNYISNLPNIHIIEGKVIHPDYDQRKDTTSEYLKSFLDLFMIANAEEVYLCNVSPLYRSGFPETAACINNRPYYEITNFENFQIQKCN